MKLLSNAILALMLVGCASNPKLPDPTVQYPIAPATLMEPGRDMQTISTGDTTIVNSSSNPR